MNKFKNVIFDSCVNGTMWSVLFGVLSLIEGPLSAPRLFSIAAVLFVMAVIVKVYDKLFMLL